MSEKTAGVLSLEEMVERVKLWYSWENFKVKISTNSTSIFFDIDNQLQIPVAAAGVFNGSCNC